jgi:hypothetical protein
MEERISIQELAILFEIPIGDVPNISPMEEAQLKKQVAEFKAIFKKQYRVLVKKYHPDVAEDKELAHEKLIKLNKYMRAINTMRIKTVQVQKPVVSEWRFEFRFSTSTTTTGTTSSTGGYYYSGTFS